MLETVFRQNKSVLDLFCSQEQVYKKKIKKTCFRDIVQSTMFDLIISIQFNSIHLSIRNGLMGRFSHNKNNIMWRF
jgi:hypothetical protein